MRAKQTQGAEQIEVTRIVDQHRVAGADEETRHQVERLRRAERKNDLIGMRLNALRREHDAQVLTQGSIAIRLAIATKTRRIFAARELASAQPC